MSQTIETVSPVVRRVLNIKSTPEQRYNFGWQAQTDKIIADYGLIVLERSGGTDGIAADNEFLVEHTEYQITRCAASLKFFMKAEVEVSEVAKEQPVDAPVAPMDLVEAREAVEATYALLMQRLAAKSVTEDVHDMLEVFTTNVQRLDTLIRASTEAVRDEAFEQ